MNKLMTISTALAAAIGLSACATQPNSNLEQAQAQYAQLQSDPRASQLAALETEDAGQAVDQATQAFEEGNEERVDQLSYVAKRRIELAEQTIALKASEEELERSAAKRAEAQLDSREQQLKSSEQELASREEQIRQLQEQLEAKQTERGTLVTLGDVLFDVDKSDLKPAGQRDVQELARFLNDNPERQLVIEGYTDSTGSDSYNQQLSQRRAESVQRALTRAGVDLQRIQVVGYGEEYPIASNDSASGRAQNRRVEVTISNDDQRVAPRSSME